MPTVMPTSMRGSGEWCLAGAESDGVKYGCRTSFPGLYDVAADTIDSYAYSFRLVARPRERR